MKKKLKTIVKRTAKLAGVVCVAAGAVALMTSKTALQAMLAGEKYFKDTVKKIIGQEPAEITQDEVMAREEDFTASDPQKEPATEVII